jgi:hypothetical protein
VPAPRLDLGRRRRLARVPGVGPWAVRRRLRPRDPGPDADLTPFELGVTSQNGEDGVLAEVLRRTGVRGRWFVEFGAGPGEEGNCVLLADALRWRGLFLEADAAQAARLASKYAASRRVATRRARVSAETVDDLLAAAGVPPELDVLSIDVDGNDYWIWRALSRFRPTVVVVEYNAALGTDDALVQPYDPDRAWDETDYFGASIRALEELGRDKGYRLVHTDLAGVNAFFVRAEHGAAFPPPERVPRRPPGYAAGALPPDPHRRAYVTPR